MSPVHKPKTPHKPTRNGSARPSWLGAKEVVIGAIVLAGVALVSMVPWLLPDLTDLPEYQFAMADTEVNPPHVWVPPTLLDEVLSKSHLPAKVSLLDKDLCATVASAFAAHPWVERVDSVRITSTPALRAELVYRLPVAFVESGSGLYAVDRHGIVLPPGDFPVDRTDRLPRLRGITHPPRGGVGAAWGDATVVAAAELAAVLAPEGDLARYWERFELRAIIATPENMPTADHPIPTFELESTGGSRILWGKAPGADDLEPTVEQKLARLEQYLLRFGSFDAPQGPYRIDIRLFDAISLQPLQTVR